MTRLAGGLVDIGDFVDTGWLALDLGTDVSAVTGYTPEARLINGIVNVRGRASYSGAWTGTLVVGSLPAGFGMEPGNTVEGGPVMYGFSSSTGRLFCTPGGNISVTGGDLIGTGDFYLSPLFWMAD